MTHIKEYELSIFMCAPCALADRISFPISTDQARSLLDEFGESFEFTDSFTGRKKSISRDAGIVTEGASL